ncbi:HD domain-containing protein [Tessaracoccus sp.]
MTPEAHGLLNDEVAAELLHRWAEPHRFYHSATHLADGLAALDLLGAGRLERMAFWFHDAVHTNSTPQDEEASARLVAQLLGPYESGATIAEIQRLVLLTAGHHTESGDVAGQRVCDADLSALGADECTYGSNVDGIRAELPRLSTEEWLLGRSAFLTRFLERERFFATVVGHELWESRARSNVQRELAQLRSAARHTPHGA